MSAPDDREAEAARLLRRAGEDSATFLGGTARRMGDHFAGRDAEPGDPIELWGRRIGRALSLLLAGALVWGLGRQLGWW